MYIREPEKLARALQPILKDRVLVRYSVRGWGEVSYTAELAVLATIDGEDFFYQAQVSLLVVHRLIQIESVFKMVSLRQQSDALEKLARRWLERSAGDWCHGEQFMGAYEINRDGQFYTSIKLPPSDSRWHLLVGVILAKLQERQRGVDPGNAVDAQSIKLMIKRFSAFTAENISAWADQTLSAH